MKTVVTLNPWDRLRQHTSARIALGRSGISQPSAPHLAFQLAHAQARDAVHRRFDVAATATAIGALGLPTLAVHSAAADRHVYLQRPDLGRALDQASTELLQAHRNTAGAGPIDLAVVVADGLSALAAERQAPPLLAALLPLLQADTPAWQLGPIVLASQARVALGDPIGALLQARLVLVLIGERPGLSSPDSLGLYLTWAPRPGRNDAERNCISNVRPEGLPHATAAHRVAQLLRAARQRQLTGVALKDESEVPAALGDGGANFLLEDSSTR